MVISPTAPGSHKYRGNVGPLAGTIAKSLAAALCTTCCRFNWTAIIHAHVENHKSARPYTQTNSLQTKAILITKPSYKTLLFKHKEKHNCRAEEIRQWIGEKNVNRNSVETSKPAELRKRSQTVPSIMLISFHIYACGRILHAAGTPAIKEALSRGTLLFHSSGELGSQ